MKTTAAIAAVIVAGVSLVPAGWHDGVFVVIEPARVAPGDKVQVRVVSGPPADAELGFDADRVSLMQRVWKGGRSNIGVRAGFRVGEPGVELIHVSGATDSALFYGKALVVVGEPAAGGRVWRSEVGHRLEIVPETDPVVLLNEGGTFVAQVLLDREPLTGAAVVAIPRTSPGARTQSLTDAMGRVRIELDRPGSWLLEVGVDPTGRDRPPRTLRSSLVLLAGPPSSGAVTR